MSHRDTVIDGSVQDSYQEAYDYDPKVICLMTRFFLERPAVNPSLGSLTLMEIVETVLFFYQTNSPNLLSCFYQRTQGIIDQRLEAAEGIRQELRRVDKVALCLTPS